jgi:hypothetical protein
MVFSQDERRKFIDDVGYDVVGHIDRFVEQGSVEFSFTEATQRPSRRGQNIARRKVGAGVADLSWKKQATTGARLCRGKERLV